ncbi:MAG: 50S ribosomal protein L16, partial [Anaerolineae bacterium]|nr:50S ribosomal protein L16 [Anaerolineae bacterium]
QRGRMKGQAKGGVTIEVGEFGLQSLEPAWVTARQIEAVRRVITREMKRRGKMWIRVFPDKPVTAKAAETRMGSGKGSVDHWVAVVKPGRMLFEVSGVDAEIAKTALSQAAYKLPMKCQVVARTE